MKDYGREFVNYLKAIFSGSAVGFSISGGTTSKTLTVEDNSLVNQDLTTDASPTFAGATLNGQVNQETYVIRKVITKTGIADNVATSIFRITTATGAQPPYDGGGYSVKVHALIGHGIATGGGNQASKSFVAQFAHIIEYTGTTGISSAVSEVTETASAAINSGSRDIGAVTMTIVQTSAHQTDVQFTIDLTGSSVTNAQIYAIIELVYGGFVTAPTITAL